jgi:hypothetical protein
MKNAPASPESEHASSQGHESDAARIRRLLEENNALIRSTDLDNGDEIVTARTAIYTEAIRIWAAEFVAEHGYTRPFAVAAVGGTGRGEICPCSDRDIVFLFEDEIESPECRAFVEKLQNQTLNGSGFRDRFGFSFDPLPYGLADVPNLKDKNLNAFLDLAPVFDPGNLTDRFRQRIREKCDSFEHLLHVQEMWRGQWKLAASMAETIDRFDIKNDGLRLFLSGVWTLGGKRFNHSREVYARIDPRVLRAYRFLLRVRGWIHLRRPAGGVATALGKHAEDDMTFADFDSFGEWAGPQATDRERMEFADEVRARLLDARRRIAAFARGVIEGELRPGRPVRPSDPARLGASGLFLADSPADISDADRSRAALRLVLLAQRYHLPIDPSELLTTFHHAGDWLQPTPELGELFRSTSGNLAAGFDFLSQIPGAEDRLFPGYGKFESSIDERVRTERTQLRSALEREKMRNLDALRKDGLPLLEAEREPGRLTDVAYQIRVEVEAALLTLPQLAGVRLALKTKRLPVTADDLAARNDVSRPLSDRFSSGFSGIPVAEYYDRYLAAGFAPESVALARFLVENRRAFREIAESGINDETAVARLRGLCENDLQRMRALYVFTLVDRHAWESAKTYPERFFNILEIFAKARMSEHRRFDPVRVFHEAGCTDPDWQDMLLDFGRDLFTGIYRHHLLRFVPFLVRLADPRTGDQAKPKAQMVNTPPFQFLGVAAPNRRGIAASISGALWKNGVALRQAHLFSATNQRLALDFFHLAPPRFVDGELAGPSHGEICRLVERAILENENISDEDEAALPDVARRVGITERHPGLFRIQADAKQDVGALIYLLCLKAGRQLKADVHGLSAETGRNGAQASVFVTLPKSMGIEAARRIVETWG